MPLSKKQRETLTELRAKDYKSIKGNDYSRLINAVFNLNESEDDKEDVVLGGIEFFKTLPQTKDYSVEEINKIILSKIKKKTKDGRPTKEMKNEERKIFQEVKDKVVEKKEDEEEKKEEEKEFVRPPMAAAATPAPQIDPEQAAAQQAQAQADMAEQFRQMMEQAAGAQQEGKSQEDAEEESFGQLLDKYINKSSKFYKDNQKDINKALSAITTKSIQDGSWFTKLASLEFPAVELLQKVVKNVGLSFNEADEADFANMLSRDIEDRNKVSSDRAFELIMKMMVNPDKVGTAIATRMGQVGQDIKDWWHKVKGEPRDLTPKEQAIADLIRERRKKHQKEADREKGIDDWMGIPEKEPEKPDTPDTGGPAHAGTGDGKIAPGGQRIPPWQEGTYVDVTGGRYSPENLNAQTVYDILLPPELQGYDDTSAFTDFFQTVYNTMTAGYFKQMVDNGNREEALRNLKANDPQAYAAYIQAVEDYKYTIAKAGLDRDSYVNYNTSKAYVDNSKDLTEKLIKEAISSGHLTRDDAAALYDAWSLYGEVASGDEKMTYRQMEELQQQLYKAIPKEILEKNRDAITDYMTNNIDYIKENWNGDSDLGNFDWLNDILDPEQEDKKDDDTPEDEDPDKPGEKKITPQKKAQEVKYRYRGKWGNTDELFERKAEEIEQRNLILEVQKLREDLDTTNQLVRNQIITEKRRFDNTFEMPQPELYRSRALPAAFKKEHRAIFQPTQINPLRDPRRNMFENPTNAYGQYQEWTDRVPESSAHSYLLKNPLIYPSNADIATGGEKPIISPAKDFNYIRNQRFLR